MVPAANEWYTYWTPSQNAMPELKAEKTGVNETTPKKPCSFLSMPANLQTKTFKTQI